VHRSGQEWSRGDRGAHWRPGNFFPSILDNLFYRECRKNIFPKGLCLPPYPPLSKGPSQTPELMLLRVLPVGPPRRYKEVPSVLQPTPRRDVVTLYMADTPGMGLGGFRRISRCSQSGATSRSRCSCSWSCSLDSHSGPLGAANSRMPSCTYGGRGGGGHHRDVSNRAERTGLEPAPPRVWAEIGWSGDSGTWVQIPPSPSNWRPYERAGARPLQLTMLKRYPLKQATDLRAKAISQALLLPSQPTLKRYPRNIGREHACTLGRVISGEWHACHSPFNESLPLEGVTV